MPFGQAVHVDEFDVPRLQCVHCLEENVFGTLFAENLSFLLAFGGRHSVQKRNISGFTQLKPFSQYVGGNSMQHGSQESGRDVFAQELFSLQQCAVPST